MNTFKRITFEGSYFDLNGYINNSILSVYERDIKGFWAKFNGLDEEVTEVNKYMLLGTLIHLYLLEPDEFEKAYRTVDYELPKSDNQKKFAFKMANISPFQDVIKQMIAAYKESYSTAGDNEVDILKKAEKLRENLQKYIEAKKIELEGKEIISWAQMSTLQKIKHNIESHEGARKLLFGDAKWAKSTDFNELEMRWQEEKSMLLCKAKLDRIEIVQKTKTINLCDLKTSSKDFKDFCNNLTDAGYIRQLAFYGRAIREFLKLNKVNPAKWTVNSFIIYINTMNFRVYVIGVEPKTIDMYDKYLGTLLDEIRESIENKWDDHGVNYYTDEQHVDKWIK